MDTKNLKSQLMARYKEFRSAYAADADHSRENLLRTLQPGQQAPSYGKIFTPQEMAEFDLTASKIRSQAKSAIEAWSKDCASERARIEPEAAATISILATRTDVTPDDIYDALQTFGDSFQAYKAITNLAREKKISFNDPGHPLAGTQEAYYELPKLVDRYFSRADAEAHYGRSWVETAFAQDLDRLLPAE